MIDWLATIFSGKSLHISFLNKLSYKRIGNSQKNVTKSSIQKKINSVGQVNEAPTTTVINNGPVYNINVQVESGGALSPEALESLQPLIQQFENKQVAFLTAESKQVVGDIKRHEENPDVRGLLKFFRHRLAPSDYQLMRRGLYLKYLREEGLLEKAKNYWTQCTAGQRPRERRIVELASADYFTTFFRPLFKQFTKANAITAQKRFDKEFEAILSDMRFAIFVHSGMSVEEIAAKVTNKAITNIKYGVRADVISLHATGASQVRRVKAAVSVLREIFPVMRVSTTPTGTEIIKVEIEYRKNSIDEALLADDVIES
jgi:hypothetical protein